MSDRFQELEEQLEQLETIPLVSTGAEDRAARRALSAPGAAQRPLQSKTEQFNPADSPHCQVSETRSRPQPESEREADSSGPLRRLASAVLHLRRRGQGAQFQALEDQAVTQCQERMQQVVGRIVEDARRQLEGLANELVPTFQTRVEKSTENSVGSLKSELTKQLEPPVQSQSRGIIFRPIPEQDDLAEMEGEWSKAKASTHAEYPVDAESIEKQLAEAFSPVVEDIQLKSAAFLDRLNVQLHSTLQAFGERATKHAAEEFGRIAVEVLERGVRYSLEPQREVRTPGSAAGLVSESTLTNANAEKPLMERQAVSAVETGRLQTATIEEQSGVKSRSSDKLPSAAPNWRILGLR
jgi:hypothetical protein